MVPEILNKAICLNFAGYKITNGFVNSLKGEKIVNGG
jgi:hypothetical protein